MKKILIITGASKGIGKQTAIHFSNNGWEVINLSRHSAALEKVKDIKIDLSLAGWNETLQPILTKELQSATQICLVHNAAFYHKDSVKNLDVAFLHTALEVNIVAPLLLNQMLIPFMVKGSSIIYVGSTLSEKAVAGNASYVVSKHASIGMMRATCQDLAHEQVHTCCICPGFTATEMLVEHLRDKPGLLQSVASRVGANRLIEPEEIASLIFYASQNPVINGSVIHANLGQIET